MEAFENIEGHMRPVASAISKHTKEASPEWVEVYNRCYEAVKGAHKAGVEHGRHEYVAMDRHTRETIIEGAIADERKRVVHMIRKLWGGRYNWIADRIEGNND